MLNPLVVPAELVDQVRALGEAVRCLPSIERMLGERLGRLESRLDSLPAEMERSLGDHFDRQREAAESLPPRMEHLLDRIDAVRDELARIRNTVEPLQGPAERLARVDDRLPGGG